tara:strand:+ start:109 stop:564 length:456 start_codon:yes stop_codon:yes gene_type:complete
MISFKTKINATFNFKSLSKKMNSIVSKAETNFGQAAEDSMKSKIDRGLSPKLSQETIKGRLEGKYWGGLQGAQYKTTSITPLKHTSALYNSLTFNKKTKTINMLAYGQVHDKGQGVPKREFIGVRESLKESQVMKPLIKEIKAAFKKRFLR